MKDKECDDMFSFEMREQEKLWCERELDMLDLESRLREIKLACLPKDYIQNNDDNKTNSENK